MKISVPFFFCIFILFLLSVKCEAQVLQKADSLRVGGKFTEAIKEYEVALSKKEQIPILDQANANLRIGICNEYLENQELALLSYFNALGLFEKLQLPERIAATCSNISNIYFLKLDNHSAEKYIKRSSGLYKSLKDSVMLSEILNDEAGIEKNKGNLKIAISLHQEALLKFRRFMSKNILCTHLFNLGSCYEKINIDSTLHYYSMAEKVAIEDQDSSLLSIIYMNIGDAYKQQRRYPEALTYLTKSLKVNELFGDSSGLSTIYHNFTDVYDSLKQYDKAYVFSKKERELNEILYNLGKAKSAKELSEKYESDKKDEKIKTQTTESKLKTRNLIISLIGLGLVSILGGISFSNYRKKQKANKILQEQNERIEKLNAQLDNSNQVKSKLFSVISHDLRSPISSLYSYLQMQNDGDEVKNTKASMAVSAQTEQLLETLEDLLIWSKSQMNEFVPVKEKVGLQNLAAQLITLFAGQSEKKELLLDNSINPGLRFNTDLNMLTIILRNLIANAVTYAPVGSTIIINALETPAHLSISISNAVVDEQGLTSATFNPSAVNSNAAGLGFVLINEFAEKLQATLSHSISNSRLETVLQFRFQ